MKISNTNLSISDRFRCFTDAKSFRRYVTAEVLTGGAYA